MTEPNIIDRFLAYIDPFTPLDTKYDAKPLTQSRLSQHVFDPKRAGFNSIYPGPMFFYIAVGPSSYIELFCTGKGVSKKIPRVIKGQMYYVADLVNGYADKRKRELREYEMPEAVAYKLIEDGRLFYKYRGSMKLQTKRDKRTKKNMVISYGPSYNAMRFLDNRDKNRNFSENENSSNNENEVQREYESVRNYGRRVFLGEGGNKRHKTHKRTRK
jgi:hypothetical protein